ncbi:MAG: DJ-1/PfpI family protein [Candidatus Kapabacteria bacterium]|nr:DJ-1/PfpI family protein [Candidatus Kapabacteria bacterium]
MRTVQIVFLILPHTHLLDLAGPDQVFLEARDYGAPLDVRYCSFTDDLHTSQHLPFGVLRPYHDLNLQRGDYLIIPGAEMKYLTSKAFRAQKPLFRWVREQYAKGVNICSVCTGAFFLGEVGLLAGKRCTTHWKRVRELQERFLSAEVQENILFTEDDGIFTSAGVASGIDLALHIVGKLTNDYTSFQVAREIVVYTRRSAHQAQQSVFMAYRNHIHAGVHAVQDWLQHNLHQKSTLEELAEIACMSSRSLTRIFKQETGVTVNEYITLLRKERIEKLLKNPNISKAEIAQQCGLRSERHVARLIAREK